MTDYQHWLTHGQPWRPARPIADLAAVLRRYGYPTGTIGNRKHLTHSPPEDHTPFAATGWPVPAAYGIVWALDIMEAPPALRLPSLSALAGQLFTDRQAKFPGARWIKYINWTMVGGGVVHDSWTPDHKRQPSSDKGHIHVSARSDCADAIMATGYDPVRRVRSPHETPAPKPVPLPTPDVTRRIVQALPILRQGSVGPNVRRLQALINANGGTLKLDGVYGAETTRQLRVAQGHLKITPDGVGSLHTWATLLGIQL